MKSITLNEKRFGNFTSSPIVKLTTNGPGKDTFGKPFYSYIQEKNMERRLGRSIQDEITARPLSWGNLVEERVFTLIGTEYKMCSSETLDHPTIDYWKGTPDLVKFDEGKTVVDIKSPYTLRSFCTFVDAFKGGIEQVRTDHPDGEKYFWQIVSNAILTGSKWGELIVYCPYQDELEEIRELAANFDGANQYRFFWIHSAQDEELPHLKKGGYYKNLNVLKFEIPQEDKDFLTERVIEAGKELVEFHKK